MKILSSHICCALVPLLFALSTVHAQDKQGTVKVDSLAVHSDQSSESDVVKTLAKGTVVRVLFTVTGDEGDWCSIASQDGTARIGFVPCSGLDRPKGSLPAAAHAGSGPQILIGRFSTAVKAPKPQTRESGDGLVGQTLAPLPGYDWGSYPETLLIAVRTGCAYCRASLPFYRLLGDQEQSSRLRAHVLLVMPDDASTGARWLKQGDVEAQGIFNQKLSALNVWGTPTALLLDSRGRIEREWVGELTSSGEKDVLAAAEE